MRGRTDSSLSSSAVTQPLKAMDAVSINASVTCLAPMPMHPRATPASIYTSNRGSCHFHEASAANALPQVMALRFVLVHRRLPFGLVAEDMLT